MRKPTTHCGDLYDEPLWPLDRVIAWISYRDKNNLDLRIVKRFSEDPQTMTKSPSEWVKEQVRVFQAKNPGKELPPEVGSGSEQAELPQLSLISDGIGIEGDTLSPFAHPSKLVEKNTEKKLLRVLRAGKIIAIDENGNRVSAKSWKQVSAFPLNLLRLRLPRDQVTTLWPERRFRQKLTESVKAAAREHLVKALKANSNICNDEARWQCLIFLEDRYGLGQIALNPSHISKHLGIGENLSQTAKARASWS